MLPAVGLVLSLVLQALADAKVVIVDDKYGDQVTGAIPTYNAPETGKVWNEGSTCTVCSLTGIDTSKAMDNTWHDATGGASAGDFSFDVTFTGYAVDVFFILVGNNQASGVVKNTNVDIVIDNDVVGNFQHNASQYSDFQYNQSIYSNSSMANTKHTLTVKTAGSSQSVLLFDYLTYTMDDSANSTSSADPSTTTQGSNTSNSTQSSKNNAAAIAGGVVGGVCAFLVLSVVLFCCIRRRRKAADNERVDLVSCFGKPGIIDPYETPTQTRPGSTTVLTTDFDFRGSPMEPGYTHGMVVPFATLSSDNNDVRKENGEQTMTGRLEAQVRFLLDEVARLRLREQLPRGTYTEDGSTPVAGSLPPPPDYATDVQHAPTGKHPRQRRGTGTKEQINHRTPLPPLPEGHGRPLESTPKT